MAIVTWLGVFPAVLLWSLVLPTPLSALHPVLVGAIVDVFVVVTLTWCLMPWLTRFFAGWLTQTQKVGQRYTDSNRCPGTLGASSMEPQLILHHGKRPRSIAISPLRLRFITDGKLTAVGSDTGDSSAGRRTNTKNRSQQPPRKSPGLNDSHLHVIRAGLFYNLELRWDGVPSIAQAMEQLKDQADKTPPPQWVRVIGGWNEFQFVEGRMPTLDEINKAAPDTPGLPTAPLRFGIC